MGKIFESKEKMFEIAVMLSKRSALKTQCLSAKELFFFFRYNGLPVGATAQLARVQPETVHSWLAEGKIPETVEKRFRLVYSLLTEASHSSLDQLYRFWNHILSFGKSLGELVGEDQLNEMLIRKALFAVDSLLDEHKKKWPTIPRLTGQEHPLFAGMREVSFDDESINDQ